MIRARNQIIPCFTRRGIFQTRSSLLWSASRLKETADCSFITSWFYFQLLIQHKFNLRHTSNDTKSDSNMVQLLDISQPGPTEKE